MDFPVFSLNVHSLTIFTLCTDSLWTLSSSLMEWRMKGCKKCTEKNEFLWYVHPRLLWKSWLLDNTCICTYVVQVHGLWSSLLLFRMTNGTMYFMFPMDGILMSLHFIFVVESFFTYLTPELMMCVSMLTQFLYGKETTITEFTGLFVVFIQTCFVTCHYSFYHMFCTIYCALYQCGLPNHQ